MFRRKKDKQKENAQGTSYILKQRNPVEKVVFFILFLVLSLYALSLVYPFVWLIINSVKHFVYYNIDISSGNAFALPNQASFHPLNYIEAFTLIEAPVSGGKVSYLRMFFNSIWYTVSADMISIFSVCCVAYVVSRFKFPGNSFLYALGIFVMTLPIVGNSGSAFKMINDFGLYNSPLFLITSIGCFGSYFLILYGYFKNISYSYSESAYLDGANELTVFLRIMLPQARPVMVTLFIMSFIGSWNDYMTILLYLPSYPTIASGMYLVKNTLLRTGKSPIYYAGIVVSVIPVMIIFIAFSDLIMQNMSLGGLKG